eukprot:COSAG06_NODE_518_length_14769_cov_75.390048_13_plen_159_part_00
MIFCQGRLGTNRGKALTKRCVLLQDFGYATDNAGWKHTDRAVLAWSPDSKKIATQQQDERNVGEWHLVKTTGGVLKRLPFFFALRRFCGAIFWFQKSTRGHLPRQARGIYKEILDENAEKRGKSRRSPGADVLEVPPPDRQRRGDVPPRHYRCEKRLF